MAATWEYQLLNFRLRRAFEQEKAGQEIADFQQRLNELGQQGWEMIAYEGSSGSCSAAARGPRA